MIETHHGTTDFPVQNILCLHCHNMMFFSHQHSSSENAVFYCNNDECSFYGVLFYMDETNKIPTIVERI